MGPPSRPTDKDKPTDMNELSDVLAGSGVDLREEEANLVRLNNSTQERSFNSNYSTSFNSFDSNNQGRWINPSIGNTNVYSPNAPGSRDTFYGAGALNQPAVSFQSPEELQDAERKRAMRRKAEMKQYHLSEPFLYGASVHQKLTTEAYAARVSIPQSGLFTPQGSQERAMHVHGPDNNERLVVLKSQDILNHDAPLVELITLLSLATEERLRSLVEDAATLAKGRRAGSNGIVPPELADMVEGEGKFETATGLPTPGNSAVSPKSNPLKRMLAACCVYLRHAHAI